MTARDVMTKDVVWIEPFSSVRQAASKMEKLNVGALPVCDGLKLVGMVTDRDIVLHSTAEGKNPDSTTVSQVMSAKVEYCLEDEGIEAIMRKMEDKKIRRLPVISHNKQLVGIISLADLAVKGGQKAACEILEKVSQPEK